MKSGLTEHKVIQEAYSYKSLEIDTIIKSNKMIYEPIIYMRFEIYKYLKGV